MRNAGIAVFCLSIVTGCSLLGAFGQKPTSGEEAQLRTVKVEPIGKQRIEEPVEVTAAVFSSVQMDVVAQTGGEVEQALKKLGDHVQAGEVVARLRSEDAVLVRNEAAMAVADVEKSIQSARQNAANDRREYEVQVKKLQFELQERTRQYNKLRNDFDSGLATASELRQAEIELEAYGIDLDLARKRLNAANGLNVLSALDTELKLAKVALQQAEEALLQQEVASPISGIISNLSVIEGTRVSGGTVIARVDKIDPVRIVAQLSEEAAELVRNRGELTYVAPDEGLLESAAVSYVASVMDPRTQTYEVGLEVPNPSVKLKPGMRVLVRLTDDSEQIVLGIPRHSVLAEEGRHYVYILKGDVVEKREVKLGRANDFYYEALSGVEEGELLVVTGQSELTDQQQVVGEPVQGQR